MTHDEYIQELQAHAERIERAEREGWLLQPITLDQRAFDLRMAKENQQAKEWFQRERTRQYG